MNIEELIEFALETPNMKVISKAISSDTRLKILKMLNDNMKKDAMPLDISTIAKMHGQTEANVSAQVKKLEKAGLVKSGYVPGQHGIRKLCFLPHDARIEVYYHK